MLTKFSWVLESNPLDRGVLTRRGEEGRLIGAAEAVWTPDRRYEFGARYAMRRTDADRLYEDGTVQDLESFADFAGGRARIDLNAWLAVHGDAPLLIERTSGTRRWDAAPAVGLRLVEGLELVTGYRFGTLRDPDFSVRGGPGAFVMLNARVTERLLPTAAEFWRSRMGR